MQLEYIHSDSYFENVTIPQGAVLKYSAFVNGQWVQKVRDSQGSIQTLAGDQAVDCLAVGNTLQVVTYDDTNHALIFDHSDSYERDIRWLTPGTRITASVVYTPESDSQNEYFVSGIVDSTNTSTGYIYLTESLYKGDFDGTTSNPLGSQLIIVSDYSDQGSAVTWRYRATLTGAGTSPEYYDGRSIIYVTTSGEYHQNSIIHTSGNYIYFSSAAPDIKGFYLKPLTALITDGVFVKARGLTANGALNIVTGWNNSVFGALNTVQGDGALASGFANYVNGTGATAIGNYNKVFGQSNFVAGVQNQVTQGFAKILGDTNKAYGFATAIMGDMNETKAATTAALGFQNKLYGMGTTAIGSLNECLASYVTAIGRSNKGSAAGATLLGYGAIASDSYTDGRGFFFGGGQDSRTQSRKNILSIRTRKKILNPLYGTSAAQGQYTWQTAYNVTYKGRLVPESLKLSATASNSTVVLDHDLYSRWELDGMNPINITLDNWINGDEGILIVDTSKHTISWPSSWIIPEGEFDDWNTTAGKYCMEIIKECDNVYAHQKVPFKTGSGVASNIRLAIAMSQPNSDSGTIQVREIEIDSQGNTQWAGQTRTASYVINEPSDSGE